MGDNSGMKYEHCMFRHCDRTTDVPVEGMVVSGRIPGWLEGKLLRNGPGIRKIGNTEYEHFFDGLSVLHQFTIRNEKAFYRSRALESDAYKKNMEANRIVVGEFGSRTFPDPCHSIFGRMKTRFLKLVGKDPEGMEMTDNCSVSLGFYGDQLFASTETSYLRRISPETLECIGEKTKITEYCGLNTATAHPHVMADEAVLNIGMQFASKKGPQYCFVRVPPASSDDPAKALNSDPAFKGAEVLAQIPSRWKFNPGYFHSFGVTEDKAIFVEQPYCVNLLAAASMPVTSWNFSQCLKWYGSEKSIFHVVSLKTGKPYPVRYETDKLFLFHHINAYEDNGCLVVDVIGYDNPNFVAYSTTYRCNEISPTTGASARRYILPLNVMEMGSGLNLVESFKTSATAVLRNGTSNVVDVTSHRFTDEFVELPKINEQFNGYKYRFFYGVEASSPLTAVPYLDKLVKIDVTNGNRTVHIVPKECFVSEPIFVGDPTKPNGEEDDGVILCPVLFQDAPKKVSLLILDAKDMEVIADVHFQAEGTTPLSFHGTWAKN